MAVNFKIQLNNVSDNSENGFEFFLNEENIPKQHCIMVDYKLPLNGK